jgi:hypothetical protein
MKKIKTIFLFVLTFVCCELYGFRDGDGTINNPYQVSTAADIISINNQLNKHYVLVNDIDMSGVVYSNALVAPDISSDVNFQGEAFSGVLDGHGYKIVNYVVNSINYYIGLFGYVSHGGVLKNLSVENCVISGDSNIGALVGLNEGYVKNCNVYQCTY